MLFRRIESPRLADAVVEQIEKLIVHGVLRPGDRLPAERDLAEQLGVSRPSLREALETLETRGIIVTRRGSGAHVADVVGSAIADPLADLLTSHPDSVFDYLRFRAVLESDAAARAAERATEPDREHLRLIITAMQEAHEEASPLRESEIDLEFHMAIFEAAGNVVALHVMRSIMRLLRRGIIYSRDHLYALPGVRDELLRQHLAIANAILEGRVEDARSAAHAHIDFIEAHLNEAELVRSRAELASLRIARKKGEG